MERAEIRRVFSGIGLSMALFMGVSQVAATVIAQVVHQSVPEIAQTDWYLWVLSYGSLYLIAFPVFLLAMRVIPDSEPPTVTGGESISAGQMAKLTVISMGVIYLLNLLTVLLSMLVELVRGRGIVNPLAEMVLSSNPWINLLIVVVVAPIMEEIIFRRLLYNKLIRFGGRVYVLFSAFVFALFHANLYQLLYAFVLGVLLAGIVYYTGTIRYSILLHMSVNLIGSGISPLLLAYAGEAAISLWGMAVLLLTVAGIVMGIGWWRKRRHSISFAPGQVPLPEKGIALLNPGMLVYMALIGAIILSSIIFY